MKLLILTVALATSALAFAQDATSSASVDASQNSSQLKAGDVTPSETKRKDIDDEITNAKLRAETGAKSLFSVQSSFGYNGGSIKEPLSDKRPSLSPGTSAESDVGVTGSIAIKYRMTDHDSLSGGIGLTWVTPTGQHTSQDPYLTYTRLWKSGAVQNVFDASLTKYTYNSKDYPMVDMKYNFQASMDYTALLGIGTSGWQLGVTNILVHNIFSDVVDSGDYQNTAEISDQVSICPFAEYAFNDKISFRTVFRNMTYQNTLGNTSTFSHDLDTQSAGLGLSVTRDIYLYPNIQWAWQDIRADKTDVALTAYINL